MSTSSRWLRVNGQHRHGCPMRRQSGKTCNCGMLAAIEEDERHGCPHRSCYTADGHWDGCMMPDEHRDGAE